MDMSPERRVCVFSKVACRFCASGLDLIHGVSIARTLAAWSGLSPEGRFPRLMELSLPDQQTQDMEEGIGPAVILDHHRPEFFVDTSIINTPSSQRGR